MKKLLVFALASVFVFVLAGCAEATLSVDSQGTSVQVVAKGGAEGAGSASISIDEGYGMCINHIVERGSFHVKATAGGKVVFDEDITNNIADLVDVQGDVELSISAKGAVGTMDIIPYDKEAQAQADATMPSDVAAALDDAKSSASAARN